MAGSRKKTSALSLNLVGAEDLSANRVIIGRGLFSLLVVLFVAILFLASVTVYNFFDSQPLRNSGNDLSYRSSSTVREQQLTKIIELNQERLNQLQDENNRRKQDVTDLETRVQELSKSIEALKQLAREVEGKIPGSPAPAPQATPSTGG